MSAGLAAFTLFHVALSLIGILSGFIVVYGLIIDRRLNGWTSLFLWTTVLTSVTGYFFPFHGITPGQIVGALSLIALAIAIYARYPKALAGGWRRAFSITAVIALYFNVFVLIVQLFEKVPALHQVAPTQTESPFKAAQSTALLLFIVLGFLSAKKFRADAV